MLNLKPMLAIEVDFEKLRYPCLVSNKLDGIRVVVRDGIVLSRSLKPIRNKHVQELFCHLEGVDGELIVGDPTAPDVFQKTTSGVMSAEGTPDVKLYAFDLWNRPSLPYYERQVQLDKLVRQESDLVIVRSFRAEDIDEVMEYADSFVSEGYEGIMIRDPMTKYKYGRSTKNSQELLKWKPFVDDEFVVIGFTERMHNANEAKRNALGNLERSSAKEGLVPTGMLGSLVLQWQTDTFECGTGFTDEQRKEIWNNQDSYLGKLAKIRYQEIGAKDKPRFPSFQGFRCPDDLS